MFFFPTYKRGASFGGRDFFSGVGFFCFFSRENFGFFFFSTEKRRPKFFFRTKLNFLGGGEKKGPFQKKKKRGPAGGG